MKRVLIIGLGLIGGSFARGLTQKGYQVSAIDPNQSSISYALGEQFIVNGATFPDPELISQADILIFGLYPNLMVAWIAQHQQHFKSGAVVTDVCGVKTAIVEGVEAILRPDIHYVGAHPMAGKEVSGVVHADPAIFRQANFILTPTATTHPESLQLVRKMAEDLGFLRISVLSPEEHDRAIGFLSQLTHVIAVSLMNCHDNEDYIKYTGNSFRDLTRIAMINEHLWSELFFANKDILVEEIDNFLEAVVHLKEQLTSNNVEGLKELFVASTNHRMKYLKPENPSNQEK